MKFLGLTSSLARLKLIYPKMGLELLGWILQEVAQAPKDYEGSNLAVANK